MLVLDREHPGMPCYKVSVVLFLQHADRLITKAGSPSRSHLLRWLVGLGGIGLFAVSIIDSSMIPLPVPGTTDLLLLFLTAHRYTTVRLAATFVAWAVAGSVIGGYLTWAAGRKGGAAALNRHVPARFQNRIVKWAKSRGTLFVGIAAVLPPPIPLLPFLLAAGALGVPRNRFLWSFGAARVVRYGLIAWVGMTYGRHVIGVWRRSLAGWSTSILWTYAGVVALGLAYGLWKFRQQRRKAA